MGRFLLLHTKIGRYSKGSKGQSVGEVIITVQQGAAAQSTTTPAAPTLKHAQQAPRRHKAAACPGDFQRPVGTCGKAWRSKADILFLQDSWRRSLSAFYVPRWVRNARHPEIMMELAER